MGSIKAQEFVLKSGEKVLVRDCAPKDAAAVLKLGRAVLDERKYMTTRPEEFKHTVKTEMEWINKHLKNPSWLLLSAEINGSIKAVVHVDIDPVRKRLAHCATMHITVDKAWRDKGIGTILTQKLLEWAEANPRLEKICLSVFSDNSRAIHVYNKLGFTVEGRRKRQYKISKGNYVDEVLMSKFVK